MTDKYVHGYTAREGERLLDQAATLEDFLLADTRYPEGSRVLEAGCGVGAQTAILARNNPGARFTSVDISEASLRAARERVAAKGCGNVEFLQGDLYALPFGPETFDHVFVCFVLEHLPDPAEALARLRLLLKPGGSVTVIEGDHGSTFFQPPGPLAERAIRALVELQASAGGDALIGRRLFPLLRGASFRDVRVVPRTVYADATRPDLVEGFTRNTYIAMVSGVRDEALRAGMMSEGEWDEAMSELERTTGPDGTFVYTFFKAAAVR
jgi:SAM-dependent methyltransferase